MSQPSDVGRFRRCGAVRVAAAVVTAALFGLACGHSLHVRPGTGPAVSPEETRLEGRLLLIGDAGKAQPAASQGQSPDPVFDAVRGDVARAPEKTVVIWLGDNVYEHGFPLPPGQPCGVRSGQTTQEEARAILGRQIAASAQARATVFIPGNHDWDRSGRCGFERILAQQKYLEDQASSGKAPRVEMLPTDGCPGPALIDTDASFPFRVIVLDTEWFLREGKPKPVQQCAAPLGLPETANEADVRRAALEKLRTLVAESGDREVVVAAHHPLRSHGPHGGFVDEPLRVLTRIRPLRQDLGNARNREMVEQIEKQLAAAASKTILAYVSGHDHSLQVLRPCPGGPFFLVSGAGSKTTGTGEGEDTLFEHAARGYMRIDALRKGAEQMQRLAVIEADEKGPHQLYSTWLKAPSGAAGGQADGGPPCDPFSGPR